MKLALAFFGLPRCTRLTIGSIRQNLIGPLACHAELRVFYHFVQQDHVRNPRSGEDHPLSADNYAPFLEFSGRTETPEECLAGAMLDELREHGDAWSDGFHSLRNLVLQLHSLDAVTRMARAFEPDAVVFARPDLIYHDPLSWGDVEHAAGAPLALTIPAWQWWRGGYNDRFAICGGRAYQPYGHRAQLALSFCRSRAEPLHGERLLRAAALLAGLQVQGIALRASRVRVTGKVRRERFSAPAGTDPRGP